MRVTRRTCASFELELTMRDVLGNLEELTLQGGYNFPANCFELLAIEPAESPYTVSTDGTADILTFPRTA